MPRGPKPTPNPVETTLPTEALADASLTTSMRAIDATPEPRPSSAPNEFTAELGESEATRPAPDAAAAEPRGRFRSWVVDTQRGYTRLTDEQEQRILLQFAQKPSADVLTAIKGAGFQFLADYEGLNHVWVRRNDFETRLQVEAIEKLIGTAPHRDSAAR